jgi:hypothetical protein
LRSTIAEISSGLARNHEADAAVVAAHHLVGGALGLVLDLVPGAADEALDLEQGAGGVEDRLAFSNLPNQTLVVLEADHRGGGAVALVVDEDDRLTALHDGDDAVGSAQVDTDCFCHATTPYRAGVVMRRSGRKRDTAERSVFTEKEYSNPRLYCQQM